MDLTTILALVKVVVAEFPSAIKTAQELTDLGAQFYKTVNGTDPTPQEIATLRAAIDADVAEALEPLPPAQPGDPDFQSN